MDGATVRNLAGGTHANIGYDSRVPLLRKSSITVDHFSACMKSAHANPILKKPRVTPSIGARSLLAKRSSSSVQALARLFFGGESHLSVILVVWFRGFCVDDGS